MSHFAAILITLIFSAFFSGMEIAFVSSNKLLFEVDKQKRKFPSQILAIFYHNPSLFIATMLVGNNIALVVYGLEMATILKPWLSQITTSETGILLMQTIISTLLILVTAEFMPKTIFRINPNFSLKIFAIPLLVCYILLYPISRFSTSFSNKVLGLLRGVPSRKPSKMVFGRMDLDNFLQESVEGDQEEIGHDVKLLQNALDFSNVKLRNCIIPRTELVSVENNVSIQELTQKFIETGLSRILVFKENIDNIIGYIHSSDLFKHPQNLKNQINKIPIVPETMSAKKLLKLLISENKSIAVVVDEFGGTSGIVTMEDIMEEIFGEIEDEHDVQEYEERQISETQFVFSARLEIDYVNEKYNLHLPQSDDFETIAGLILFYHGSLPIINEEITIRHFVFKIIKTTAAKIELVQLTIR